MANKFIPFPQQTDMHMFPESKKKGTPNKLSLGKVPSMEVLQVPLAALSLVSQVIVTMETDHHLVGGERERKKDTHAATKQAGKFFVFGMKLRMG